MVAHRWKDFDFRSLSTKLHICSSYRKGESVVVTKSHLDLRYPFPRRGLIDRHLDGLFVVRHHYGPQ